MWDTPYDDVNFLLFMSHNHGVTSFALSRPQIKQHKILGLAIDYQILKLYGFQLLCLYNYRDLSQLEPDE